MTEHTQEGNRSIGRGFRLIENWERTAVLSLAALAAFSLNLARAAEPSRSEPRATLLGTILNGEGNRLADYRAALLGRFDSISPVHLSLDDAPVQPTAMPAPNGAEEDDGPIEDNSFLIEEAYNQEPGIVQHIFNWARGWDWDNGRSRTFDFVFTQEWPIGSQDHQFSYTIPVSSVYERQGGLSTDEAGIGDILLNYRYQLSAETDCCPAISPRFSLILPSGEEERGLGNGEVGYQFNLPVSKNVDDWTYHFNAGFTVTPDVGAQLGPGLGRPHHTLEGYNLGASAIWLARQDLNFMLETVALWEEEFTDRGDTDDAFQFILSPGVRWAPYTCGDTQWVLGAGLPIGLTSDSPDITLFLYMSYEHRYKQTDCQ